MIANHIASAMSQLDLQVIVAVPEGGNWKDIPESVPSQRLAQIRRSYAEGKGSRSTYYGRLTRDMPAYTISTNFGRPGCGCNTHYEQDRTLTSREAARLQSFPDSFVFEGSWASVAKQVGNAVPPVLAYQAARALPVQGAFVDLFSGAGGLALGFTWAGWEPVVAADIDKTFLATHGRNLPGEVVLGDLCSDETRGAVCDAAERYRAEHPDMPLFVLGGPPCQGFSTANARSSSDARNWLFREYVKVLEAVRPDGFVFENVMGMLSLEKGAFFERIKSSLEGCVEAIRVHKVNAANYGVPQRRERLIVVGGSQELVDAVGLRPITRVDVRTRSVSRTTNAGVTPDMPLVPTVEQAIGDLPPVEPGGDATGVDYATPATCPYQQLVRGEITAEEYVASFERG